MSVGDTPKTPNALYPCAASELMHVVLLALVPLAGLVEGDAAELEVGLAWPALFQGWKYGCAPPGISASFTADSGLAAAGALAVPAAPWCCIRPSSAGRQPQRPRA